jgi:DNA-binding transcriptional LysR family regulator
VDLFRLRCFIALADELHFRHAAERCHISQPAMSQQIRRLEEEVGTELAVRTKRSVRLTHAGETFLVEARRAVQGLDDAARVARQVADGVHGRLRVGVTAPALFVVYPEIARAFSEHRPEISVSVDVLHTADQEQALQRGDLDLGIVHPPLDDADIECVDLASWPFRIALPSDHPLTERETLTMADLEGEPLVLFPRRTAPRLYDSIIELCMRTGFSPTIVMDAHPAQSIVALAASGVGIGFVASPQDSFHRDGVIYRQLVGAQPALDIGIAFGAAERHPALDDFLEVARQSVLAG